LESGYLSEVSNGGGFFEATADEHRKEYEPPDVQEEYQSAPPDNQFYSLSSSAFSKASVGRTSLRILDSGNVACWVCDVCGSTIMFQNMTCNLCTIGQRPAALISSSKKYEQTKVVTSCVKKIDSSDEDSNSPLRRDKPVSFMMQPDLDNLGTEGNTVAAEDPVDMDSDYFDELPSEYVHIFESQGEVLEAKTSSNSSRTDIDVKLDKDFLESDALESSENSLTSDFGVNYHNILPTPKKTPTLTSIASISSASSISQPNSEVVSNCSSVVTSSKPTSSSFHDLNQLSSTIERPSYTSSSLSLSSFSSSSPSVLSSSLDSSLSSPNLIQDFPSYPSSASSFFSASSSSSSAASSSSSLSAPIIPSSPSSSFSCSSVSSRPSSLSASLLSSSSSSSSLPSSSALRTFIPSAFVSAPTPASSLEDMQLYAAQEEVSLLCVYFVENFIMGFY
jgi:hypothetical protein